MIVQQVHIADLRATAAVNCAPVSESRENKSKKNDNTIRKDLPLRPKDQPIDKERKS